MAVTPASGRVPLPGPGVAEGRHGPRAARRVPRGARRLRRGRRRARASAVEALLRGARGGADADRERAAGDPDDQRRGAARARGAVDRCGRSPWRGTRSASTRAGRGRARCGWPTRSGWCTCAASSCRRRCRPAWARWPRSSGCRAETSPPRAARPRGARGRQPGQPQRRRPGRDRRAQGRRRARHAPLPRRAAPSARSRCR